MKGRLLLCFVLINTVLLSQSITGVITSEGVPVENLSVIIKDLNIGTVSNAYGEYRITSRKLEKNTSYDVIIKGLGYKTKTVSLTTGKKETIELEAVIEGLDEVEITGYKKSPTLNNIRENSISKLPVLQKYQIPNVNTVNLETLQEQRITSLSQAVNLVPGFTFDESRGNTFVTLKVRGYRATQLYNGLRLESNSRSGDGNVNFNLIDNVEFVTGSTGIRYGNAIAGGAVNVNSKQAKLANAGGALASFGSFDNFNIAVDKNVKLNDKIGFRINGAYAKGRNARIYTDFSNYGVTPSFVFKPTENDEIRLDYSFFHDERTPDKGSLVRSPYDAISQDNLVNTSLTNSFVGFKQDYQKEDTHVGTFSYNRKLDEDWDLDMRLGVYNRNRASRQLNHVRSIGLSRADSTYTHINRASVTQEDVSRTYSSALNIIGKDVKAFGILHNIQAGVDYWDNYNNMTGFDNVDYDRRGNVLPDERQVFSVRDFYTEGNVVAIDTVHYDNPVFNNDIETMTEEQKAFYYYKNLNARAESFKSNIGVVLQDQVVFSDKLRLTLGGRFSYVENYNNEISNLNEDTETITKGDTGYFRGWSFNSGLFYDINPNVTVFTTYADTFNESNVSAIRVDINGDIIPQETINQYEIGARTTWFDNLLSANLNLYYMVNNDVGIRALEEDGRTRKTSVDAIKTGNPNGEYFLMAEAEYRQGVELNLQGNITPQWSLLGSYTFFEYHVEPTEGEDLENRYRNGQPKHSGTFWTKYKFNSGALKGFSIGTGAQIIGDRPITAVGVRNVNPSYTKWDAIVGYKFNKNLHLTAKFNNLTDVVGFDSYEALIVNPIQPFNFDVRLNYNF